MLRVAVGVAGLAATVAGASAITPTSPPAAVSLNARNWLGIDGNWSTVEFQVGSPSQIVDVLISTATSEFWVVGTGGCLLRDPICSAARGYVFDPTQSKTWSPLGIWQLGLTYLGTIASGNYGLESMAMLSSITGQPFAMDGVITATINTTSYYQGMLGLGITQGSFGTKILDSPLTQAVEQYGWIPSYSFGYTAGAYYKNTPVSVTLGGYDSSRFVAHDTTFNLDQTDGSSPALVRGIEISAVGGKSAPSSWGGNSQMLSNMNSSFQALIDSSTPFLWLPDTICDAFAAALGLTYNTSLDLYTLTDEQFSSLNNFEFTFSLSSYDNHDTYGGALNTPGVINITVSGPAFGQVLRYPFMNLISYGAPAVPYFPLRRLHNSTYAIIGRSFLQEAYMLMKYDSGVFSIHQALFPHDPMRQANVSMVPRPPGSPFPAAPPYTKTASGLSTAQVASIAAGIFALCVIALGLLWWFWWRKRRLARKAARRAINMRDPDKDGSSSFTAETPRTPVSRILSRIIRKKRSRKSGSSKSGEIISTAEVASEGHELYELPAPFGPVELEAADDHHSLHGETELGTRGPATLSAYELARLKLDRQLQGPVPAYTPPLSGTTPPGEKAMTDVSPIGTHRPVEGSSFIVSPSPTFDPASNSLLNTLPSPMSPHGDWTNRIADLPSPLTMAPPFPSPISPVYASSSSGPGTLPSAAGHGTLDRSTVSRSNSSNATSPVSPGGGSLVPPSPSYQRTPIDPSRIVCLGPLPENVQVPKDAPAPRRAAGSSRRSAGSSSRGVRSASRGGAALPAPPAITTNANHSTDTLGSNFTEVEEEEMTRHASLSQGRGTASQPQSPVELSSPRSQERIDAGSELIHVPQPAEKRYSWEE